MSTDRVIRWAPPVQAPTAEALGTLACNYTRDLATSVEWHGGRWYITLPGEAHSAVGRAFLHNPGQARWIEVWRDDESVYVMTRHADEVTNAVAEASPLSLPATGRGSVRRHDPRRARPRPLPHRHARPALRAARSVAMVGSGAWAAGAEAGGGLMGAGEARRDGRRDR